jgi:oligoendopeptidase F
VKKIFKILTFDLTKISFDFEDRKDKYPSPICFFVQIPQDIRILYKSESPYFDLQGCFHESGHAMHASSINPKLEYWKKYFISMGVAEIFSILLERLTKNRIFLQNNLGIKESRLLDKLEQRNNFMELFFVTFYSANSLMKADFWKRDLNVSESNLLYSDLVKRFTGIKVPGEYWMLHHILPEAIMYVPSYLFAAVRAKELDLALVNQFGENYLKALMSQGLDIDLSSFSNLDTSLFLKEIRSI